METLPHCQPARAAGRRPRTPGAGHWTWLLLLVLALLPPGLHAAPCSQDDHTLQVTGESQCLVMRRFGATEPEVMLVWLHGDVSSGGPASYHFEVAEAATQALAADKVLSVALVRPGYPDGSGNASTASLMHSGRSDHYTRENLGEVAGAIEKLRARYQPRQVIAVGHSGGAATAAVLLGLRPGLLDAAVLVSCPCDLVAWRQGRRAWSRSENPIRWADQVPAGTRVVALTGDADANTDRSLAQSYVEKLQARGARARFVALAGESHNGAFRSPEVLQALRTLISER